jgi:hypothetical protein
MQRNNSQAPKYQRHKNSARTLQEHLLPISILQGEKYPQARDEKQKRDAPHVQHGHDGPKSCQRLWIGDETYQETPGLEYNGYMVKQQQSNGNDAQVVDVVSSIPFHDYFSIAAILGRVFSM